MVRTYVKKLDGRTYSRYKPETVDEALVAIRDHNFSIREASRKFNIPFGTLHNKLNGLHTGRPGRPTELTPSQEANLCETIKIAGEWGYPLTAGNIIKLVKDFLVQHKINNRFANNTPGKDWFASFMKRNQKTLTSRWSQNIKRNRAKIDSDIINLYFDKLESTIESVPPENIINFDETNFTDDPESKKVVVRKGQKHVENILDHSKSSYSVMFAGSADGKLLVPYVVYSALHLYPTWTEGGPAGCRYNRTKSGNLVNV